MFVTRPLLFDLNIRITQLYTDIYALKTYPFKLTGLLIPCLNKIKGKRKKEKIMTNTETNRI